MMNVAKLVAEGSFETLPFGISPTQTETLLGDSEGKIEHDDVEIEKYGEFQLHFDQSRLLSIYWVRSGETAPPFLINENHPDGSTDLDRFLWFCDELKIPWSIYQNLTFDRQLAIRTRPNVIAVFDLADRKIENIIAKEVPFEPWPECESV
jgi:hypothetical protein